MQFPTGLKGMCVPLRPDGDGRHALPRRAIRDVFQRIFSKQCFRSYPGTREGTGVQFPTGVKGPCLPLHPDADGCGVLLRLVFAPAAIA